MLVFEVDYQKGAEPYIDAGAFQGEPWDLFELNMKALFNYAPTDLKIPKTLSAMGSIPATDRDRFTLQEIAELSKKYQDTENRGPERVIHIMFLNGRSVDDAGNDEEVLGLSIAGSNVIAMFKPVIEAQSSRYPELVEQGTLIHEVGHAAGLVNAGLPMVGDHLDRNADHGKAHCENRDCVMYWEFEGGAGVDNRLRALLERDSQILFGDECRTDADAAAGRPRE